MSMAGTSRVARSSGVELDAALDALLPVEPNLCYANFAPIARREGAAVALHRRRFHASSAELGVLLARDAAGRPAAALRLDRRPFESAHLGLAMAKLELPAAVPDEERRLPALRALYAAALGHLREEGFVHVAARTSTRDRTAGWVLQELGGFHVDSQVSWMAALTGSPHDDHLPPPLRLEIHDRASLAGLDAASWKRLAQWGASAFDRGPLVFDLRLSLAQTMRIYEVWTEKVMTGEWAEALLVVRDGAEIVAFNSKLTLEDVSEAAGVHVCGRGLGATLPDYRGLFTALQREMNFARPLRADFMENETQVATIGSINTYAKLGHRYLRSTSTFHVHLEHERRR